MTRISAVIITKNEEKNVIRCLDSIKGVADEIIVYDSYSTDQTGSLCIPYNVRFIQAIWEGYAETKNKANALATHEYILSIDADEALSDELRQSILLVKNNLRSYYAFNRLNNYCGRWIRYGGFYPDRKIRLFPKAQTYWEGGHVHETLHLQSGQPVTPLKGDLLHYSYSTFSEHVQRADRYSGLAAEDLVNKKGKYLKMWTNPVFRFIRLYFLMGGFRDGFHGFVLISITSFEVFLKYAKAIKLKKGS